MTNYGTIPTSSSTSSPPINLEYISRAKERLKEGLGTRRPWRVMFDRHCFSLPRSVHDALARVKTNLGFFRMNYALAALVVLFLSLIFHPLSLIVFLACMALWLFLYFLRDEPLVVFGKLVNDRVVLIVLAVVTLAALLFTHAVTEILVALLVAVVLVLLHAAVRKTDDLVNGDEEGLLGGQT